MSKCKYDLSENCNNKDCLECILSKIEAEINTSNRGTCDYFIIDQIEEIVHKYKDRKEQ